MRREKPVPAFVELTFADPKNDASDFFGLGLLLYDRGYVHEMPREIIRDPERPERVFWIVTFFDRFAAKRWLRDPEFLHYYEVAVAEQLTGPPVVRRMRDPSQDIDDERTCFCSERSSLCVDAEGFNHASALRCGVCRSVVPNHAIPFGRDLESWARVYRRVTRPGSTPGCSRPGRCRSCRTRKAS